MDKELRSIIFTIIRFTVGFFFSVFGYMFMSICVASFLGFNGVEEGIDVIHMGIAGLCLFTVGEGIITNVGKQMDEETKKESVENGN